MGPPLGRSHERTSPRRVKFGWSARTSSRAAAHAVSGAPMIAPVLQATTSRTQYVRFTDEVPRRPVFGRVSPDYKSHTKGQGQASEAGTTFPRPRPKGCQQRQSRGRRPGRLAGPHACSERQNLRVPHGPLRFMGQVSPAVQATKWPEGTSSSQTAGLLSNGPQQPESGRAAVRSRLEKSPWPCFPSPK